VTPEREIWKPLPSARQVTPGVAAAATGAAEAEVATGLEAGWAVAGGALADGVALDGAAVADDALAPQAGSASPAPRPSTEMLAILTIFDDGGDGASRR